MFFCILVESKEDTINFFGLELESASGRVWKKSLEASLHEQKMYNTATSALVKGVVRWAAWTVFAVGVHGADNLFSFQFLIRFLFQLQIIKS